MGSHWIQLSSPLFALKSLLIPSKAKSISKTRHGL
ncbi:unnamed protein product [Medioppia subpectinata]|uniref:Uncharacterized protein n=1 Tax=Medioppia subpectinata TaxID=1979941 RepID=A0A7R9QD54_9ACAR|nr:unnamed protein product [Medioppia subpectinata]CAG2118622.1 unnamed protein product [Medioppia subpectinata]